MKIVNLQVENVMRLSAVNITPAGNIVVIGGKNGAGKSSVLNSVMYGLAGGKSLPEKPLKEGCHNGHVIIDLGELIVTRKFRKKEDGTVASEVEITNGEGFKKNKPQELLNSLYGKMTFDPLEFSRLKQKEQIDTLKNLVNIDFTELDAKKASLYSERTDVSRSLQEKSAQLNGLNFTIELGIEEISISNLMDELSKLEASNLLHNKNVSEINAVNDNINKNKIKVEEAELEIERLRTVIADFRLHEMDLFAKINRLSKYIDDCPLQDTYPIKDKIKNAESINQKIRENSHYMKLTDEINILSDKKIDKTEKIKAIDEEKTRIMADTKFPIDGLGFDETGVTMHGIPFEQSSSAEKLKISVAMGSALNPKLKIMQIRDGSLLDEDSMKIIDQLAIASDMQIWIERVSEGKECSVIISDGYVKGDTDFL